MAARKTTNPIAAEATHSLIEFDYDGESYAVIPTNDWTLDALEAFEDGKVLTLLRHVLAEGGYAKFRRTHNGVEDIQGFMAALQKAQGIAGN
ncbi:tail assembly chaperone [Microbacterium phage Gretchen]|uniref:Tail assembly chaperone n=1 Tax=Microbacterium phage Percival TaxID=2201439 RepID=A0A2Z4Q6N7_9CAUD|nr:tail assembly chaperone [Microbacterium phage Percival]UDL14787.1 tail assembly chaperone [Microbacterium phage Gretchen]